MKKLTSKQIIFYSLLALMLLSTLLAWIPAIVASMKEFYAGLDLSEASYVGLKNYKMVLISAEGISSLKGSYIISGIAAVISGILIYGIGSLLMLAKKTIRTAVVSVSAICSGLCIILLMINEAVYPMLADMGYFSVLIYALLETLAYLAIPLVIAAAYAKNSKDVMKISVLFAIIRILMSLSFTGGDITLFSDFYSVPPIATHQGVFYSLHRIGGDYCTTNALSVLGALWSMPVAVAGAVIIHIMYKERVGLITALLCALIISLNQEGITYFCMRMIGHYAIINNEVVLKFGYILIRLLPYFAMFMLIWKITGEFKKTVIPVIVISIVRLVLSRSLYVNGFIGIIPQKIYSMYMSQGSAEVTSYIIICIVLGMLCAASVWISEIINKEK